MQFLGFSCCYGNKLRLSMEVPREDSLAVMPTVSKPILSRHSWLFEAQAVLGKKKVTFYIQSNHSGCHLLTQHNF